MSDYQKRLGAYGENLAAVFLAKNGCHILERNFRAKCGEIDLIAQLGDEILFVEVKTRSNSNSGYPETAVNYHKLAKIRQTADRYLLKNQLQVYWRLDVISIQINRQNKSAKITWFKNINETG